MYLLSRKKDERRETEYKHQNATAKTFLLRNICFLLIDDTIR